MELFIDDGAKDRRPARKLRRPSPLAIAALGGIALIGFATIPYDALGPTDDAALQEVERMPGEARVTSADQVITLYQLDPNLETYLSVDAEGRILFEPAAQEKPGDVK